MSVKSDQGVESAIDEVTAGPKGPQLVQKTIQMLKKAQKDVKDATGKDKIAPIIKTISRMDLSETYDGDWGKYVTVPLEDIQDDGNSFPSLSSALDAALDVVDYLPIEG